MRIVVVGLGNLGLPLAAFFLSRGNDVTGADISVARLRRIAERAQDVISEPGVEEALRTAEREQRWRTTTDTAAAAASADVVVIIVPVHASSSEDVDLDALRSAAAAVARGTRAGTLIILESTVPTGATRHIVGGALEATGRRPGADVMLAYSPERVSVGSVFRDLERYPKIVGGIDAASTVAAQDFYAGLGLKVWPVRDMETAEFTKLIETTYRDANIALANSFAVAADRLGVDAIQAIRCANSQPYSHIHMPGVGVGGNCIPVYPYLYAASAPAGTDLALAARRLNDGMARYAVERLTRELGGIGASTSVIVLGITYRPGVKQTANSSALGLLRELKASGARVFGADPLLSEEEILGLGFEPAGPGRWPRADAVVLQNAATEFESLDWVAATDCRVVLDGRAVLDPERIRAAGVRYIGIGRA